MEEAGKSRLSIDKIDNTEFDSSEAQTLSEEHLLSQQSKAASPYRPTTAMTSMTTSSYGGVDASQEIPEPSAFAPNWSRHQDLPFTVKDLQEVDLDMNGGSSLSKCILNYISRLSNSSPQIAYYLQV